MTQAGWYPDPHNAAGRRYWDGDDWTERTDAPAAAPNIPALTVVELDKQSSAVSTSAEYGSGWYPDPQQQGVQRYWDGTAWTQHTAPAVHRAAFGGSQQVVIVNNSQKSSGVAFILGLVFGPLGMLYATVPGAILMFLFMTIVGFIVGFATFGFGLAVFLPLSFVICGIWAAVSSNRKNMNPHIVMANNSYHH